MGHAQTFTPNYHHFAGTHWETGSIHNVLAYQGVTAPHTGQPFSEALLLGLSGGIAVMYFTFDYEGFDPHVYLGTRYPFDAVDGLIGRLGIRADVRHTSSSRRARADLVETLDAGQPAVVWADAFSLPYNGWLPDEFGLMMPIVVYGYDERQGVVNVADRAACPLTATPDQLAAARARQSSVQHRLMALDGSTGVPDLAAAVQDSIRACASLYFDKPPKGPRSNFGLNALQKWVRLLLDDGHERGWAAFFAPGAALYHALVNCFEAIELRDACGSASRPLYADFLDEAALILDRPALREVGGAFRAAGTLWRKLADCLLPDWIAPFKEARDLFRQRRDTFLQCGQAMLSDVQAISARLRQFDAEVSAAFPITAGEIARLREDIAAALENILAAERDAAMALRDATA